MVDDKLIERFIETFPSSPLSTVFRSAVGERDAKGKLAATYFTLQRGVRAADVEAHFAGRNCLVLKPFLADDKSVLWASIDLDEYGGDALARCEARIKEHNLPLRCFTSKSGGVHAFLFLDEPRKATEIRALLAEWVANMGYPPKTEIFPKQDGVSDGNLGVGIAAPFFADPDGFAQFAPERHRYVPVNGNGNGTAPPLALRIPKGIVLRDVLARKLRFKVRTKGARIFYDYHGIGGLDGQPQPCLIQGTLHAVQRANVRQSSFVEEDGRFHHSCFDSDCRDRTMLAGGGLGTENIEPADVLSKTRCALLKLDELVGGASVYEELCGAPGQPTAYGVRPATPRTMNAGLSAAPQGVVVEAKDVKRVEEVGLRDMTDAVLDGRLGELCQKRLLPRAPLSYAWPSLVTVAATMTPRFSDMRVNLYTALVGPTHSSKSQTGEHAAWLLGIEKPQLVKMMSGSAEGMLKELDREPPNGDDRLIAVDELGHLLEKGKIEGSSFPYILNRAFYDDRFVVTMARGAKVEFACRLSLLGGIVEEQFEDCFASNTTGGLYDRFIFGLCPSGFVYDYRPFEGEAEEQRRLVPVKISPDVWELKTELLKRDNTLNPRVVENALRVAVICAAFDGRCVLLANDLGPALASIQYQTSVRKFLVPNPGRSFEGILAAKFLAYLGKHAPEGEWVSRSRMLQNTRAYDFGPSVADKAIQSLEFNGEIETAKAGKQRVLRRVPPQL